MSATIRLDLMLREAVATPYSDLVTRPTGVAVRHHVIAVLRGMQDRNAALDFSQVGLIDFSCADEVIAKLLVETVGLAMPRLLLRGVRDHHAEAIEHALLRYDLVVVAMLADGDAPQLLGAASDDWRNAFRVLASLGRAAALPVAQALSWPLARTSDALQGLARGRCVIQHADETFDLGAVA